MCLREKIGPDPRNFNQRVSLGRNDLLIRTFPNYLLQVEPIALACFCFEMKGVRRFLSLVLLFSIVSYYLYYNTIQNAQSITGYGVSDFLIFYDYLWNKFCWEIFVLYTFHIDKFLLTLDSV